MKAAFCTLGCKVNQYDTQAMRELFEDAGYDIVDFSQEADVYVINTCTVTHTGDKKSRAMIARAHALNPDAKIVVAGCYSETAPDEVRALPGVSLVTGTRERLRILDFLNEQGQNMQNNGASIKFEMLSATREGRTRAHLKIQEGCNRYCSYCIIPYARGPVRSRPLENVREELVKLNEAHFHEVVLTGIHLLSYGADLEKGISIIDAIEQAQGLQNIQRIRLGSLEPQLMTDALIDYIAGNASVCRHFHLSLQSGSNSVLKRMNRRYSAEDYALIVRKLRQAMPGCAITTDIIAGFPGETEEEHCHTLDFVRGIAFSKIHVFPYSRRKGTKAYDMPLQLTSAEKAARAKALIALGEQLQRDYLLRYIGSEVSVLFEERSGENISGHTSTYVKVLAPAKNDDLLGYFAHVCIEGAKSDCLTGRIIL